MVHGVEDDRVCCVFGTQGGGLGDQRKQFGAVREVVVQLLGIKVVGEALRSRVVRRCDLLRILSKLMHVDHVGQGSQAMQRRQQVAALQAFGQRPEEEHRDRGVDHVADRALHEREPVEGPFRTAFGGVTERESEGEHAGQHDQQAR